MQGVMIIDVLLRGLLRTPSDLRMPHHLLYTCCSLLFRNHFCAFSSCHRTSPLITNTRVRPIVLPFLTSGCALCRLHGAQFEAWAYGTTFRLGRLMHDRSGCAKLASLASTFSVDRAAMQYTSPVLRIGMRSPDVRLNRKHSVAVLWHSYAASGHLAILSMGGGVVRPLPGTKSSWFGSNQLSS